MSFNWKNEKLALKATEVIFSCSVTVYWSLSWSLKITICLLLCLHVCRSSLKRIMPALGYWMCFSWCSLVLLWQFWPSSVAAFHCWKRSVFDRWWLGYTVVIEAGFFLSSPITLFVHLGIGLELWSPLLQSLPLPVIHSSFIAPYLGVPWRQPHCRSGLATLPSVGAIP